MVSEAAMIDTEQGARTVYMRGWHRAAAGWPRATKGQALWAQAAPPRKEQDAHICYAQGRWRIHQL